MGQHGLGRGVDVRAMDVPGCRQRTVLTASVCGAQVTFDSYLYKTVQGNDPVGDMKLGWKTLSSLYKFNNQKTPDPMRTLA